MGVVADIERSLARQRARQRDDSVPELRTSTLTHVVWAPPRWLAKAQSTLAGLAERHPARTIFLIPEPGRLDRVEAAATVYDFAVREGREVLSEVIEIRLRGRPAEHPASIVLPLLISDLPAYCRWRGEPLWEGSALAEILGVCDRFVVDSAEWSRPERGYRRLLSLFDEIAVSDLAFRRTLGWRVRLAELWPGIRKIRELRVAGPDADAALLAGWLQSRLRREITLRATRAASVGRVTVDGVHVEQPAGAAPGGSELLSAELDVLARDRVYEAAVRTVVRTMPSP
jgi:glucose-6-phosphate dehydrogenase assembly protein OpcA